MSARKINVLPKDKIYLYIYVLIGFNSKFIGYPLKKRIKKNFQRQALLINQGFFYMYNRWKRKKYVTQGCQCLVYTSNCFGWRHTLILHKEKMVDILFAILLTFYNGSLHLWETRFSWVITKKNKQTKKKWFVDLIFFWLTKLRRKRYHIEYQILLFAFKTPNRGKGEYKVINESERNHI